MPPQPYCCYIKDYQSPLMQSTAKQLICIIG